MKLSPINLYTNSSASFKGISKLTRTDEFVDHNKKLDVTNKYFDYYSFKDDLSSRIEEEKKYIERKSELHLPEDAENGMTKCINYIIENAKKLPITNEQFDTFKKKGVSDDTLFKSLGVDEN